MRVPHYAMRSLAVVALIGLMTGCGGNDSTAPDAPFDPAGTTSDIDAIEASYESDAMYGFQSAMPAISATLGQSAAAVALRAAPSKIMAAGKSGAREYVGTIARLYTAPTTGMRPVGGRDAENQSKCTSDDCLCGFRLQPEGRERSRNPVHR